MATASLTSTSTSTIHHTGYTATARRRSASLPAVSGGVQNISHGRTSQRTPAVQSRFSCPHAPDSSFSPSSFSFSPSCPSCARSCGLSCIGCRARISIGKPQFLKKGGILAASDRQGRRVATYCGLFPPPPQIKERDPGVDKDDDEPQGAGGSPIVKAVAGLAGAAALGFEIAAVAGGAFALKGTIFEDPATTMEAVEKFLESAGPLGPAYFGAAYVTATMLLVPASVFIVASGFVFGVSRGAAAVSISSLLSASGAYFVSRYLARPQFAQFLEGNQKFSAVEQAISEEGWRIVFLMRLSPIVPFGLSNYMFGLTRIDYVPYALASVIGLLPATFAYTWLGEVGRTALDGSAAEKSELELILYVVGLIATFLVLGLVSKQASKILQESGAGQEE